MQKHRESRFQIPPRMRNIACFGPKGGDTCTISWGRDKSRASTFARVDQNTSVYVIVVNRDEAIHDEEASV
jgi:hypothetical protein